MATIDVARGPAVNGTVAGTVVEFDPLGGYGTVMAKSPGDQSGDQSAGRPGDRWFFHCTAIVDGSRTIAIGATVQFEVAPGRMGRFEARNLRPQP